MNLREAVYFGLVGLRGQTLGPYYKQILREEQEGIPADTIYKLLIKLLTHCKKFVPYYTNIINKTGDSFAEDPEEYMRHFPILTKEIIRSRFEDLKSSDLERRKWFLNTSGGSTGEPVRFIQDWEYAARSGAISLLFSKLIGREIGESAVQIWGSERDIIDGEERYTARLINKITNTVFVNAFCLTPQRLREFIAQINAKPPKLIVSYTKLMYEIAMFAEREGLKVMPQAAVITTAEKLFPFMRNKIQEIFGCNVYNRYGSREVGDIACERPGLRGLWVAPWGNYVEIVDSEGKPVPNNTEGEILVTSLTNYAMPLVRYQIGDRGIISFSENNGKDKNRKVLREVLGRISDTFKNKNGTLIDPGYFEYLLYFKNWILNFQVIQKDYSSIIFKIVKSKTDPHPDEIKKIVKKTKLIMGDDCKVEFDFVDQIEYSGSGKYRFTISEIHS